MGTGFDFHGRRIAVVGAAMGLGRATANLIAELGGEVVALDVEPVEIAGGVFVKVDLKDPASITAAASSVSGAIHGICNVAGVGSGSGFSALDIATINYVGVRTLTEGLLARLERGSAIVCVSSGASKTWQGREDQFPPLLAQPDFAHARAWLESHPEVNDGYPFSKRALNHWAEMIKPTLWAEKAVRINVITPGLMDTRMPRNSAVDSFEGLIDNYESRGGRLIQPAEQAWLLAFLVSSRSSTINGELIVADGGFAAPHMMAPR